MPACRILSRRSKLAPFSQRPAPLTYRICVWSHKDKANVKPLATYLQRNQEKRELFQRREPAGNLAGSVFVLSALICTMGYPEPRRAVGILRARMWGNFHKCSRPFWLDTNRKEKKKKTLATRGELLAANSFPIIRSTIIRITSSRTNSPGKWISG